MQKIKQPLEHLEKKDGGVIIVRVMLKAAN